MVEHAPSNLTAHRPLDRGQVVGALRDPLRSPNAIELGKVG